jgi:hypothetical protein
MLKPKPTTGRLLQILPDGSRKVLAQDKTFPALQQLKKEYILYGFKKDKLKITY